MKIYPFAEQGNWTSVHNQAFDTIMPRISANAWKVLCLIIRQTEGFAKSDGSRRKSYGLSYSDIQEGTGIRSHTTIAAALSELLDDTVFGAPLILTKDAEKRGVSRREKTLYALNKKGFSVETRPQTPVKKPKASSKVGAPENGVPPKTGTPKNGASRTPENEVRKPAPIKTTRSNQKKNKESNSLSAREAANEFDENENQTPTDKAPFIEGEADDRFETPHFAAVADVCALDLDLILWPDKARAATVAAQLATKYTPDQIRLAGERWELPTPPHPRQLLSRIKALLIEPKPTQINPDGTDKNPAAPKFESAAERHGRDLAESFDDLLARRAALEERKRQFADGVARDSAGTGLAPRT